MDWCAGRWICWKTAGEAERPHSARTFGLAVGSGPASCFGAGRREDVGGHSARWPAEVPANLSSDDPWLALAEARQLVRHGTLARAVVMYRKAESLTTDLDVAALCRTERRQAAQWLPGGDVVAGDWTGLIRRATRTNPDRAARSAVLGEGPQGRVAAGLAELLAGALDRAETLLSDAADDPSAGEETVRIAAYARSTIGLLTDRIRSDPGKLEAVVLDAEVADHPWWARLGIRADGSRRRASQHP